ncbi:MAG: NAD+ synthase [Chloroflexota bacterium]
MDPLQIDTDVVELVLRRFLHDEITKAGFNRGVIGLSGGVDSALACYLAAEALGPENILALSMPYQHSSPDSLEHAQMVVDELGVACETIDITSIVNPLYLMSPGIDDNRRGNIMARTRMIILYDRSAAWKGLVVGTSNKSELILGYGTLFGDLASAVNPLGDLYKTQVRQLAKAVGVPQVIIEKKPSADLIPGQTDEGDLGFTYADVDQVLYLLVDKRYSPEDVEEAGYQAEFIQKVLEMIHSSHFKRRLPVIAKVSERTIGHDFRYLRDSGL